MIGHHFQNTNNLDKHEYNIQRVKTNTEKINATCNTKWKHLQHVHNLADATGANAPPILFVCLLLAF